LSSCERLASKVSENTIVAYLDKEAM